MVCQVRDLVTALCQALSFQLNCQHCKNRNYRIYQVRSRACSPLLSLPLAPCPRVLGLAPGSWLSSSSRWGCPGKESHPMFDIAGDIGAHLHIIFVDVNDVALQVILELFQLCRFSSQTSDCLLKNTSCTSGRK